MSSSKSLPGWSHLATRECTSPPYFPEIGYFTRKGNALASTPKTRISNTNSVDTWKESSCHHLHEGHVSRWTLPVSAEFHLEVKATLIRLVEVAIFRSDSQLCVDS